MQKWVAVLLVLGVVAVYLATMPTAIGLGDSGLLAAAATTLGIPHPPGFPAYVMLGHVFTKLPWGSVVWRLELLSVLAAVGIVALVARRAGWLAALILAFSYGFWSQAVNVETYALTNLVILTLALLALKRIGGIGRIGVIGGIGLGLNPIVVAVIPALVWRIRKIRVIGGIGVIGLITAALVYSYLPIRAAAHPFLNWGNPSSGERWVKYVTGGGLSVTSSTAVNGFTGSWRWFVDAWWRFGYLAVVEFVGVGTVLAILGAVAMYRRDRREFWFWALIVATNVSLAGFYTSGNRDSWYITSFMVMAIFIGQIGEIRRIGVIGMIGIAVVPLLVWGPKMWQRARSDFVMQYVNDLYIDLPKDAVLLGGGETFNALTVYAHEVLKLRPDVIPVDMTIFYGQKWYRENRGDKGDWEDRVEMPKFTDELEFSRILEQLAEAMGERPVFVTGYLLRQPIYANSLTPAYVPQKYQLEPEGIVYRLTDQISNFKFLISNELKKPPFFLETNYRKAIELIRMEYGLAYEMRGDYFGANRVAPEYFDQNRLREKMNQEASPSAVPSER